MWIRLIGATVSDSPKPARSLAGIAGIVAAATLLSKVVGLLRQQGIAAAFSVGPVADAYGLAYVIPGFLLVLLGGINGPFHSAIVSVIAKRKKEDIAPLIETLNTLTAIALFTLTVALIVFADPIISLVGYGVDPSAASHAIAVRQLQIMAPMAIFAGLIGIGFGTLNADDQYWLPSVSPLFSSLAVLVALGALALTLGRDVTAPEYALLGGSVLALGTLSGAILQWLVQLPALWRSRLGSLRPRFNFQDPGVRDVLRVLAPATFASGMMQINVFTDLVFASAIPTTIAALNYANLLVQTPLGIVSNVILVPYLPIFARLADPQNWPELKQRIRQALMLTALTMLPLSALMVTLALPIVRVVYERGAFDQSASQIVTSVLMAYGIGMFVYLGRDVMVRVFYALGDGQTPFRISLFNIGLNALLDYILINLFGAPGLVLATVGVNVVSLALMLILLSRKLNGLPWLDWSRPIIALTLSSGLAGVVCWVTRHGLERVLGTEGFGVQLIQLAIAAALGLGTFALCTIMLRIPEATLLVNRLRQKFLRR